jgi:hypothetical protein
MMTFAILEEANVGRLNNVASEQGSNFHSFKAGQSKFTSHKKF